MSGGLNFPLHHRTIVRRYDYKKADGLGFRSAIPRQTGCTIDHVKCNSNRQALNGQSIFFPSTYYKNSNEYRNFAVVGQIGP